MLGPVAGVAGQRLDRETIEFQAAQLAKGVISRAEDTLSDPVFMTPFGTQGEEGPGECVSFPDCGHAAGFNTYHTLQASGQPCMMCRTPLKSREPIVVLVIKEQREKLYGVAKELADLTRRKFLLEKQKDTSLLPSAQPIEQINEAQVQVPPELDVLSCGHVIDRTEIPDKCPQASCKKTITQRVHDFAIREFIMASRTMFLNMQAELEKIKQEVGALQKLPNLVFAEIARVVNTQRIIAEGYEIPCRSSDGPRGTLETDRPLTPPIDAREVDEYYPHVRRWTLKNKVKGALFSYVRVSMTDDVAGAGAEAGRVSIMIGTEWQSDLEKYLAATKKAYLKQIREQFGFVAAWKAGRRIGLKLNPKEASPNGQAYKERTTINCNGEHVPMGVYVAKTQEELEFLLWALTQDNNMAGPDIGLLQDLVSSSDNWRGVEERHKCHIDEQVNVWNKEKRAAALKKNAEKGKGPQAGQAVKKEDMSLKRGLRRCDFFREYDYFYESMSLRKTITNIFQGACNGVHTVATSIFRAIRYCARKIIHLSIAICTSKIAKISFFVVGMIGFIHLVHTEPHYWPLAHP